MEGLSDEEVTKLVEIYETVKKYQDELAQTAKDADPKKYAEIEAKYERDLAKLDEDYSMDLEALQEKKDHEMDLIEEQTRRRLGDLLYKQQVEYTELDDEHKKIYSTLTSALTKSQ